MRNEIESITPILDTRPDVPTELADRKSRRDRVAEYFRAHPGIDVEQDDLEPFAGSAITQRVRECVRELNMDIASVPTYLTDATGKHRLRNRYRFTEHQPLGRDAADYRDQPALFELHQR